jgi:serine/threonine protein kinase
MMQNGRFLTSACGSPHYSSPEILVKGPYVGPEVDVWSIGVILFAMLTGCLPWDGDGTLNQINNSKITTNIYSLKIWRHKSATPLQADFGYHPQSQLIVPI